MPSEHAQNIINQLVTEYDASVKRLQAALAHYLKDRTPPSADQRASNDFCYPELVITYAGKQRETQSNLAFGKLEKVGTCLLYTSPSPRDRQKSRMPSSA